LAADRGELGPDRGGLDAEEGPDGELWDRKALRKELPGEVLRELDAMGERPRSRVLRSVIERLTAERAYTPGELAQLLGLKDAAKLVERHLAPMVHDGILRRTHPDVPSHPRQAYAAVQTTLVKSREPGGDDDDGEAQ
jgi:hypothetical protein